MQSSKQGLSTQMSTPPPLKNSHGPEEACACDEAGAKGIDCDGGSAGGQAAAQFTCKEDVAELGVLSGSSGGAGGGERRQVRGRPGGGSSAHVQRGRCRAWNPGSSGGAGGGEGESGSIEKIRDTQ